MTTILLDIEIRPETHNDHREVETLTRMAFWNLYVPGCDEHYLVHLLRQHPDFIPELDLVAALKEKVVGNIMYARSHIVDKFDNRVETLTFGPVSVLPEFQRQGVGSALIQHSSKMALEMGYGAIIIHGHPNNYCKHGFKGSKAYNIRDAEGRFPFGLLALELKSGFLKGRQWKYLPSEVYDIDAEAAEVFDKQFPPLKKEYRHTQEEFRIASKAYIL